MHRKAFILPLLLALMVWTVISCCPRQSTDIRSGNLLLKVDKFLRTEIGSGYVTGIPMTDRFNASEYLVTKYFKADAFEQDSARETTLNDLIGEGYKYTFLGSFSQNGDKLQKKLEIKVYKDFPDMAFLQVTYKNTGDRDIEVKKWVNGHYEIKPAGDTPAFWSFQGGTTNERKDWVLPVNKGFYQQNYLGMTSSDYGGGIPVTDIWRKDGGIAIGHTELSPREVSLPVDLDEYAEDVVIGIENKYPEMLVLKPGSEVRTDETFVMVHRKDHFSTLQEYTNYMKVRGLQFAETEKDAYGAMWCAWGYERNFTIDEIIGTLPKVKELGIKWVGIDDGFQIAEGDWYLDPKKFPNGDSDMRRLVEQIHKNGMKAMIWWAPLAADPGSRILKEDRDVLLFNEDWSPRYITWWDSWLMSPAYKGTILHTQEVLDMFLGTWGFDGIKIDGQHVNEVPADYHPGHGLSEPSECIAKLPEFFRMVYAYSRKIKPNAVIEICPCGCCISYYLAPVLNQAVASDPTSSWQVRLKGKTYKAIIGPTAYFGDHVELIDIADGFATQMGIGAVLGSKFTWPKDNPDASQSFLLTPEKEREWQKWFGLYNEKMLPEGIYLGNLYDIGYDKPESHAIEKGGIVYYAFYAPEWKGRIELRGLSSGKSYSVRDYVNGKDFGSIKGEDPWIDTGFSHYLLLEAVPAQ